MKRLNILILAFLLVHFGQVAAQQAKLRFIAGYPDFELQPNVEKDAVDVVYTSAILRVAGDSLVEDLVLSDSLHRLYYMKLYHHNNKGLTIIAKKENRFANVPSEELKVIQFGTTVGDSTVFNIETTTTQHNTTYQVFPYLIVPIENNNGLSLGLLYSNFSIPKNSLTPRTVFRVQDLSDGKISVSTPAFHNRLVANGNCLAPYLNNNNDGLYLHADTVNNQLLIPSLLTIDSVYHTPLPEDLVVSKSGAFVVINDPQVRVMYFYEFDERKAAVTFRIYDKEKRAWKRLTLNTVKNAKLLMKNFNGWLAGASKVQNTENAWTERNRQPGQEAWTRERTRYSPSIYEILESQNKSWFSHGTQFLYNINTGALIEWETGQADSEILLVSGQTVYYRKYDEIYSARIINGNKLGDHRLVLRHKYVPAIHFMFKAE